MIYLKDHIVLPLLSNFLSCIFPTNTLLNSFIIITCLKIKVKDMPNCHNVVILSTVKIGKKQKNS